MSFLYETHLHTSQASECAGSRGSDYIKAYIDQGFSGIFVTDHFYHGNSCLDKNLAWKEWVKRFCSGYEDALNEGERRNFDVFFGWEESFEGDDYLIYGLDKEWLLMHPEVKKWTRKEQYETVNSFGGCIIQAHPFRQRYYINKISLSKVYVDGIEAANACNEQEQDALAMRYGSALGLPMSAGSDIHSVKQAQEARVFGIKTQKKLNTINDYVRLVMEKKHFDLFYTAGRLDYTGKEKISLPLEILGENDTIIGRNPDIFLGKIS